MFGRSGQMFPRRAYHDAIYQEEYSDSGEDCCRNRGLSAVVCWFLSVIILIGLAASVILTVFFILKSRSFVGKSSHGEDLDLLYNFEGPELPDIAQDGSEESIISIPPTTTRTPSSTITSTLRTEIRPGGAASDFAFTSPPFSILKRLNPNSNTNTNNGIYYNKEVTTTSASSTMSSKERDIPSVSTRRTYLSIPTRTTMSTNTERQLQNGEPTLSYAKPSPTNSLFDKLKKYNSDLFPKTISKENLDKTSREITSNESGEKSFNSIPPTEMSRGKTLIQIDSDPNPLLLFTTAPNSKVKNYQRTTRLPRVKSFHPYSTEFKDFTSSERTLLEIKSHISPTIEVHLDRHSVSVETELESPPPPSLISAEESRDRNDVLYRIIKNLSPKFKNETTPVTTSTSAGSPFNRMQKTTTTASTISTTNLPVTWTDVHEEDVGLNLFQEDTRHQHHESTGFEIVQGPNFTAHNDDAFSSTTDNDNRFLDILVGSEDQKTLITKETEAGIITSAILPPWFENDTFNETVSELLNSNSTVRFDNNNESTTEPFIQNRENENSTSTTSTPSRLSADISNLFLNWFSNSPTPYNKTGVDKITNNEAYESKIKTKEQEPAKKSSWRDLLKGLSPIFPAAPNKNSHTKIIPEPAKNAFHFGTTDGTSDIYGYYSEDPATAQSHQGFGEKLHITDRIDEYPMQNSPSHVIDIAYDPKEQPEIIIEPDDPRMDYNYGDYMDASGSEVQPQVVVPAPEGLDESRLTGSGIRRPMDSVEDQLQNAEGNQIPKNHVNISSNANSTKSSNVTNTISSVGNGTEFENVEQNKINLFENFNKSSDILSANAEPDPPIYEDDDYDFIRMPDSPTVASNPIQGNDLSKRKPVRGLDLNLYPTQIVSSPRDPISVEDPDEPTTKKVFQVYAVKPSTPREPASSEVDQYSAESETNTKKQSDIHVGFVPPKPLSFHSNSYAFSPSVSTGGFLPSENGNPDNWRPVVYDMDLEKLANANTASTRHPNANAIQNRNQITNAYEPPTHRETSSSAFPEPVVNPLYIPPFAPAPAPTKSTPSLVVLSTPNSAGGSGEDRNVHIWMSSTQDPVAVRLGPPMPIKPSQQIPVLDEPMNSRIKYSNQQQHSQQIQQSASLQNPVIDRSKFMFRPPVTPPVVMRRAPQHNLPFLPNRNQVHKNSPTFPRVPPHFMNQQHQLKQQQRLKQHLYEQNLIRIQNRNGNVQWPNENMTNRMQQIPQLPFSQNRRVG